jgi:hypothetical protein
MVDFKLKFQNLVDLNQLGWWPWIYLEIRVFDGASNLN